MSNVNIKLLRKNKAIWTLIRVFYQLGLKIWQFVTRATDLEIDFRKLECEEVNSGYISTCTREENDDEKRLPCEEKLAYELGRGRSRLPGLGWAGPNLAWTGRRGGHYPGIPEIPNFFVNLEFEILKFGFSVWNWVNSVFVKYISVNQKNQIFYYMYKCINI